MELRIEYRYDRESRNWCFTVPVLGIVGGADTREEAETRAMEAVRFTLESDAAAPAPADVDVGYLHRTGACKGQIELDGQQNETGRREVSRFCTSLNPCAPFSAGKGGGGG